MNDVFKIRGGEIVPDIADKNFQKVYEDAVSAKLQDNFRGTKNDIEKLSKAKKVEKIIQLSNNSVDVSHDIDFADGWVFDEETGSALISPGAMTKKLDNPSGTNKWEAGDGGNGLLDNAGAARALANSTWYAAYAIGGKSVKDDLGVLPLGSPMTDLPSGYTRYKHLGYLRTDASANLRPFFQEGNHFFWKTSANDYTLANPGTSAVLAAVHGPPDTVCNVNFSIRNDGADGVFYGLMTSPYSGDIAPTYLINTVSSRGGTSGSSTNTTTIKLDTSSRVRYRLSASGANHHSSLRVEGWIDTKI